MIPFCLLITKGKHSKGAYPGIDHHPQPDKASQDLQHLPLHTPTLCLSQEVRLQGRDGWHYALQALSAGLYGPQGSACVHENDETFWTESREQEKTIHLPLEGVCSSGHVFHFTLPKYVAKTVNQSNTLCQSRFLSITLHTESDSSYAQSMQSSPQKQPKTIEGPKRIQLGPFQSQRIPAVRLGNPPQCFSISYCFPSHCLFPLVSFASLLNGSSVKRLPSNRVCFFGKKGGTSDFVACSRSSVLYH